MSSRFPHFFAPAGAGDLLLGKATTAKITLSRWPADLAEEPPESEIEFELKGSFPITGDGAAELLSALVNEFRTPRSPQQEGGVA